jgi:2-(1,2-epoxy-1,2-dihydrophenyl)acetyl-CoA isomerase
MNAQMWLDLDDALRGIERRPDDRVVVLSGADGAFCSGADLREPRAGLHPLRRMEAINRIGRALYELSRPTIASVDGVALGAGCNLALACDLVVASDVSRFGEMFVRRGLSIDMGGSWILPRLVGLQRAKAMCLMGEIIGAEEAAAIGMIYRCVPPEQLAGVVDDLARKLSAGPPVAMTLTKRLLDAGSGSTLDEALRAEQLAQIVNHATTDAAEAKQAFLDKREALFSGTWFSDAASEP